MEAIQWHKETQSKFKISKYKIKKLHNDKPTPVQMVLICCSALDKGFLGFLLLTLVVSALQTKASVNLKWHCPRRASPPCGTPGCSHSLWHEKNTEILLSHVLNKDEPIIPVLFVNFKLSDMAGNTSLSVIHHFEITSERFYKIAERWIRSNCSVI